MSYRIHYVFTQNLAKEIFPGFTNSRFLEERCDQLRQILLCREDKVSDETIIQQLQNGVLFNEDYSSMRLRTFTKRLLKIVKEGVIIVGDKMHSVHNI